MTPELALPFDSALTLLLCPNCGHSNTHHTVVDVYSRGEDLPETRTRIGGDEMSSIGNPSSRRSGLNIGFYCENCPRLFWLRIEQHKGETYLSAERGLLREVDDEPTAAADSETVPTAPESIEHILRQV